MERFDSTRQEQASSIVVSSHILKSGAESKVIHLPTKQTNADIVEKNVIPAGTATLSGASTYVGNSAVESAVLAVAVEVFQARTAAGGQIEGVDFTVSPFRLGRSLFNRVSGLLGAYLDVETMAQ